MADNETSNSSRSLETNHLIAVLNALMTEFPDYPVRVIHNLQDDTEIGTVLINRIYDVKLDKIAELNESNPLHMLPGVYDYNDMMDDPLWAMETGMETTAYEQMIDAHSNLDEAAMERFIRKNIIRNMPWQDIIAVYIG